MSLKEAILNQNLPSDDNVLAELRAARQSGKYPAQHIGQAIEQAIKSNSPAAMVLRRYPKTLSFLCEADNMDWIINDMERTLNYLKMMSEWLNKQSR